MAPLVGSFQGHSVRLQITSVPKPQSPKCWWILISFNDEALIFQPRRVRECWIIHVCGGGGRGGGGRLTLTNGHVGFQIEF